MANRPVFIPNIKYGKLVTETMIDFNWHAGMSIQQKQKSITSLHNAAKILGISPILEISTKSTLPLGRQLSAFNLQLSTSENEKISVEAAYQGGKVFEKGGPYRDLYRLGGREIKADRRLQESGRLVAFDFDGLRWPLEPKTAFYDWLYVSALCQNDVLSDEFYKYQGFTDIEFNPAKSINCQARSAALFVALSKKNLLQEVIKDRDYFIEILSHGIMPDQRGSLQLRLL